MSVDEATMEEMLDELVVFGEDDWIMFDDLVSIAYWNDARGQEQTREFVLALLREALERGLVTVGDIDGVFVAWQGSVDSLVDRVDREWRRLGREPSFGEVCWLVNTPEGNRRVEQLPLIPGDAPDA